MLSGEKILITGPAGQIAYPLARYLAADNEVWGIARFGDEESRARVDELGVTTRVCDMASGDFSALPDDFTYVLHLAAFQGPGLDFDHAITVNAEGTGLLLAHCRRANAALVMSTHSVYRPLPARSSTSSTGGTAPSSPPPTGRSRRTRARDRRAVGRPNAWT